MSQHLKLARAFFVPRRFSSSSLSTNPANLNTVSKFPLPQPQNDLPLPTSLIDIQRNDVYTPTDSRMHEHYQTTLITDLMYLTYNHKDPSVPDPSTEDQKYIPGLTANNKEFKKHERPKYYNTNLKKPPPARTANNVIGLKAIMVFSVVKEAVENKFSLLNAIAQIESITGKYPEIIKAKSDIALYKLRAGTPIGCKVRLEGDDMYQFLDKFVELVLPRLKNWYGIHEDVGDGTGNIRLSFEPKVMSYFPEIEQTFDRFPAMSKFDLTFQTTAFTDWEARLLLSGFQIPVENAASKAKREKYLQNDSNAIDPNEPEWMKFKRAREESAAKRK